MPTIGRLPPMQSRSDWPWSRTTRRDFGSIPRGCGRELDPAARFLTWRAIAARQRDKPTTSRCNHDVEQPGALCQVLRARCWPGASAERLPHARKQETSVSEEFSAMDDDTLAAVVSTLAAHIHAATGRLLALIAELDRREVRSAQGALTCAHWLSWARGIDTRTAREKVRVARALTGLPLLSEAIAQGELGYSKVRALTRIATPENEADLLNIGLHGTAQHVEKFVRLHRRAGRAEETERADARPPRPHATRRSIHMDLEELNDEAARLAARINRNFDELGV